MENINYKSKLLKNKISPNQTYRSIHNSDVFSHINTDRNQKKDIALMDVETGRPNKKDIALMDVETDIDSRGSSNIMSGL
jgi:hypothetical protein